MLVLGIVLLALAFTSPLSPYAARSLRHGWELGHIFLFAILTFLFFYYPAKRFPRSHRFFYITLLSTLLLGLAIEFIQMYVGRDFSLGDLGFDLIGSLTALCCLIAGGALVINRWLSRAVTVLTAVLGIYAIAPVLFAVVDEVNMGRSFPLLADFESTLEVDRWQGDVEIVNLLSSRGEEKVLRIPLSTTHYSGVSLSYFPRDWRAYKQLSFEFFNPDRRPLDLTIRIHDNKHYDLGKGDYDDRFNRVLEVMPGWNRFSVDLRDLAKAPANRDMDLANIQEFGLFSIDLPKPRVIYIDKVRLEP